MFTANSNRLTIGSNGNVGIGTTTPVSTLVAHNSGNAASGGSNNYALVVNQGTAETNGQATGILFTQGYSNANQGGASIRYITSNSGFGKGDLAFFMKRGFSGVTGEDPFEALRIKTYTDKSHVGIGTSAARQTLAGVDAFSLDVSGQIFGRIPVAVITTTSINLDASQNTHANCYFYITNSGFNAITLPTSTSTNSGGQFYQIKNATSSYLSITLTNTLTLSSPVTISPSNAITFVVSPAAPNTMLLF
jgi:hypothetical protein